MLPAYAAEFIAILQIHFGCLQTQVGDWQEEGEGETKRHATEKKNRGKRAQRCEGLGQKVAEYDRPASP